MNCVTDASSEEGAVALVVHARTVRRSSDADSLWRLGDFGGARSVAMTSAPWRSWTDAWWQHSLTKGEADGYLTITSLDLPSGG